MIDDAHAEWLARAGDDLIDFGRGATLSTGGFGWLDSRGRVDPTKPLHTYLNARMTHVFALAAIRGRPGTLELAAHGVAALSGLLHDDVHDGWFAAVAPDGTPVDPSKTAYEHAFVVLAAASAAAAKVEGACGLLQDALDVVDHRFWDAGVGRCVDGYDRTLTVVEDYRGANANMHMVEAFLAAGDVLA
ncbi:MAG: AGE family epimerase/isomerase, partial [Jiangellaceae bacterium]